MVHQGELVWCRGTNSKIPGWGIVLEQHHTYLRDGKTLMISWTVFIDGNMVLYDHYEVVSAQYYKRHIYHE